MGVSTDAYLFYGFNIHDSEADEPFWVDDEFDELGLEDFLLDKVAPGLRESYYKKNEIDYKEFKARKKKAMKGIKVEYSQHVDYPVWFVAIEESFHQAWRGSDVELSEDQLKVQPDWDQRLQEFCEKAGIEYQQPTFVLASYSDFH